MIERRTIEDHREKRYRGWADDLGASILSGGVSLDALESRVAAGEIDPRPVSGRQELAENLVNQRIWAADLPSRVETGARG